MLDNNLIAIILAAGKSKRMLSDTSKVMYQIAGKSMLQHLIDSVNQLNVQYIYIIYGTHNKEIIEVVESKAQGAPIFWVLQTSPKGTGHAVQVVLPRIDDNSEILILYGDVPLVSYKTLEKLRYVKSQCDISLLTANVINPQGYGRIIRNTYGDVISIIEDVNIIDLNHKQIKEINSGIFITVSKHLKNWLNIIKYEDSQNELYLTDIINIAYKNCFQISTVHPQKMFEVMGINTKSDLIRAERAFQREQADNLLKLGVMISDPCRFDLRGDLVCGKDVYIDVNVIIEGNVSLGDRVRIGANCILKNSIIDNDVCVHPFSMIENTTINVKSKIGPFARLRPGTRLNEETIVGNFVELKNTQLGKKTKVNHLSYLGDSYVGSQVNIGAGTVICNYDGVKKNRTNIGDNVFIGADSQLIAPVTIGKNAIVGAGTTVTADVKSGTTVISRVRQFSIVSKKS